MNPFSFFEKIYIINLDERTDRWEKCLDTFKEYELNLYERVSGVKILEEEFHYLDQKSRSQLGCALSFYRIIKNAYDNQFENILIFEDDFHFIHPKEKTYEILKNSIENLPENWDVFYLGANIMYDFFHNPISVFNEKLFKLNSCYCMHSISFSKKGIRIFLENFHNEWFFIQSILEVYKAIDVFMAKEFCDKNLCFISNEMLCIQSPSFSSIENCMTDYSDLVSRYNNSIDKLNF
jgi:GR25 family glycosyltransferase involved in LPS biosynthesis